MDVMLDIETLATSQRAVVLSIGALQFELYHEGPRIEERLNAFFAVLDLREQIELGREVDKTTVKWWQDQTQAARDHWANALHVGNITSLSPALSNLRHFCKGARTIWANGAVFDLGILQTLYADLGDEAPWKYNAPRDMRTVCAEFEARRIKIDAPRIFGGVPHHPLTDCEEQIHKLWAHWPAELPPAPPPQDMPSYTEELVERCVTDSLD